MKLNLGCGPHLIEGWVNIDLNVPLGAKGEFRQLDLSREKLPYSDASVDLIFSEHFIEHITREQAQRLLQDCHRVLKPDGAMRISTPHLGKLIERYWEADLWSIPGVWEPKSLCQMVNEGMRSWGHQFLYDLNELEELLKECGFKQVRVADHQISRYDPDLSGLEVRPYQNDLIVEAIKE